LRETEIKLKIENLGEFRKRLRVMGARYVGQGRGRVHELNTVFDTPEGGLEKQGQLLRVRAVSLGVGSGAGPRGPAKRVLVTFKRPVAGQTKETEFGDKNSEYKVREEIELEISAADKMGKIFEGLGMRPHFHYEKYRTTFQISGKNSWGKGLKIELDETPIGAFVELEGTAEAIDHAAKELGYRKDDYILKNYLVLYLEECNRKGMKPGDMVFTKSK
jgi:adenylate cyclase class 2